MKTTWLAVRQWMSTTWGLTTTIVGVLVIASQAQAAWNNLEWAAPAWRGYVRDVVLSRATEDAVRIAQNEAKADARFLILEGLAMQQNIDTLLAQLKILRPQKIALETLLMEKPGNATLLGQIADTAAEIADTENDVRKAKCRLENRGRPNFGNC